MREMFKSLTKRTSWASRIFITQELREEWKWWVNSIQSWPGSDPNRMNKRPDLIITTDASEWGWGAWLQIDQDTISTSGRFPDEVATQSSNFRELTGIIMAILAFNHLVKGKAVLIQSDNTTSIACVIKLRSPSEKLNNLTQYLVHLCQTLDMTVTAIHLAGKDNDLADYLSRFSETGDWATSTVVFNQLDQIWGPHSIDRFASWLNKKVPRYNSAVLDSQAEAIDAFSVTTWRMTPPGFKPVTEENNFINPPFHLLDKVVNKIITDRATATLIVPVWPQHPWYREALQHAIDIIDLSSLPNLFLPGLYGNSRLMGPPSWKVLACRFCWT
jgi:hypothetical protein